jgi:hypothetical protein
VVGELPTEFPGFREIQLSDRENSMLKQDISRTGIWEETAGKHWTVYYLRWLPGSMLSRIEARGHRPEVCMRAGGFRLEEDFGSTVFDVSGIGFSFHRYAFEYEGGKVHVFFCLWEDGAENLPRTETLTYKDRLHAALRAQRRVGQRSVEIILRGYPSLEEAESAVRSRLPDLIQIEQARLAATIPGGR